MSSEAALPWMGAALGLATVTVAFAMGRSLVGARAAFLGAIALATTESFFRYQARARLDPPLTLLFTGSVALLVLARGRAAWLLAGGVAAGIGALVKGPPALGAPVAAALALLALGRKEDLRRLRSWLLVAAPALALPALFLLYDRIALGGTWWTGYVHGQFLASALGRRQDGAADHLFLLRTTLGRMGPWVALLAVALADAARSPGTARSRATWAFLAWATVVVGGYSLAGRAWWHYAMPAWVPLSLASGVGLERLLSLAGERGFAIFHRIALAAAAVLVLALPFRTARLLVGPCSLASLPILSRQIAPPGTRVAVVSDRVAVVEAGILAQHAHLEAVPIVGLETLDSRPDLALALVDRRLALPAGWRAEGENARWVMARRSLRGGGQAGERMAPEGSAGSRAAGEAHR